MVCWWCHSGWQSRQTEDVWWNNISEIGPEYVYHPNASKPWFIVKEGNLEEATTLFQGTGVSITEKERRHLRAANGTRTFVEGYVQQKVTRWIQKVEHLSTITVTQPHATYAAFTCCLASKYIHIPSKNHFKSWRSHQTCWRCNKTEVFAISHRPKYVNDADRDQMALTV